VAFETSVLGWMILASFIWLPLAVTGETLRLFCKVDMIRVGWYGDYRFKGEKVQDERHYDYQKRI
jgi:hypothetical protein